MALLNAQPDSRIEKTAAKSKLTKGDRRITVTCDEIEETVFGARHDRKKRLDARRTGQVERQERVVNRKASIWKTSLILAPTKM